jgi:hypothetical protein
MQPVEGLDRVAQGTQRTVTPTSCGHLSPKVRLPAKSHPKNRDGSVG